MTMALSQTTMLYVARILWCQTNILVSMNTLLTAHFRCHPLQIPTLWNKYFSGKLRISSQPPQKSSGDSVLALSLSSVLLLILSSVFYPLPLFFLIIFFRFLYRTLTKYIEASIFSQLCCCWFQTSMIHIIYSFKWWSWLKINSEFRGLKAKKKGQPEMPKFHAFYVRKITRCFCFQFSSILIQRTLLRLGAGDIQHAKF